MRSIDRGFYTQYVFKTPQMWPHIPSTMFRHSEKRRMTIGPVQCAPPRWLDLMSVLDRNNLLNRWIYRTHVEALLKRFSITSKDAFQTVWRERTELRQVGMLREKTGLVRFISEYTDKPLRHDQGVIELDSWATKLDAMEYFNNFQFELGTSGGSLADYPIPGLNHRYATVNISNEREFNRYLADTNHLRSQEARYQQVKTRMTPRGPVMTTSRAYSATLYVDSYPLQAVLPYDGIEKMVASPVVDPDRQSSLSVRDQKIDELQKKLNDLIKSIGSR